MQKNLCVKENVSLKKYHTYQIDAKARFLVEVKSIFELNEAILFKKERSLPFVIIGRGSNILFRDDYYSGLVIVNKIKDFKIEGEKVTASSGVNMQLLARATSKLGLSGFQSLVGIPGTTGGIIYMNAGTNLNQISDYLISVDVLDQNGDIKTLAKNECDFSYRYSRFQKSGEVILSATFLLEKKADAYKELEIHLAQRLNTQPVDKKNSGCIFKNPEGKHAGMIIDSLGLKGRSFGGAMVSKKHANFIDNIGNATFDDVMQLIEIVKKEVKSKTEVELEYEVWIL